METERICPNCRKPLPPDVPLGLCPECLIKAGFPTEHAAPAAAGQFVPPPVEELAPLFPQLEILGLIGKGGMGAVYKARQPALDRLVALKILPPAVGNDPGFAERFNREARALARLNHPNIVAVHDFGQAGPLHFLVMEFVDGANLREIEQAGKLSPDQALSIVPQICEALQFAHNEGIVHRDIKPENLLLDKRGRLKITDFGIAKIIGAPGGKISLTGAKDVVGTPHYMAPEQIEKPQSVDHRADIYSLGVVFYEMLTGELPLGKFAPPSRKVQVDVRLDEVVLHSLEKEPARRYQHASQVKTDVETIATTAPPAGAAGTGAVPPAMSPSPSPAASDKIILPAFLLAFFFGIFGAHRFYVGRIWTGLLQLATCGGWILLIIVCAVVSSDRVQAAAGVCLAALICGCIFWSTIDWILILCKVFTDGQGRRITQWVHGEPGSAPRRTASPPPATPSGRVPGNGSASRGVIVAPAILLLVAAIFKLMSGLKTLAVFVWPGNDFLNSIFANVGFLSWPQGTALLGSSAVLFKIVPGLLILFGAVEMMQIRSYAWSVAAAVVAIVSCSLIGLPAGIWALIVLARADVRTTFENAPGPRQAPTARWLLLLAAMAIAGLFSVYVRAHLPPASPSRPPQAAQTHSFTDTIVAAAMPDPATNVVADPDPLPVAASDPAVKVQQAAPVALPVPTAKAVARTNAPAMVIDIGESTDFARSFAMAPGGTFTLKVDRGDVELTGGDGEVVEVQVRREVTRAGDEAAAQILRDEHVTLKQSGNQLSVTARNPAALRGNYFWGLLEQPHLEVHYRISVPRKFTLQVETSGGDVTLSTAQGPATLKTMGGRVKCISVDGPVDGQTMGGEVQAAGCGGRLNLSTMGGDVSVDNFSGPSVRATTMGGSVSVDFAVAPSADCELHTSGGNVTATIPETAAITVDAHTAGGEVRTDLPVQVEGKFRGSTLQGTMHGGGPVLKLQTMGGNINLRRHRT
ncbi:MAG TPA: protein kinase [Verrucomicrobiae bacterium]|nr:protein kinase [Verrucomicrobiae bacterium]